MLMLEFGVKLLEMLAIADVKGVIFTNSLIGTTIQDSGKRERSNGTLRSLYFIFYLFSLI